MGALIIGHQVPGLMSERELRAFADEHPRRHRYDDVFGVLQRQCTKCEEWWTASLDLFMSQPGAPLGLHCWCKACVYETKRSRGQR